MRHPKLLLVAFAAVAALTGCVVAPYDGYYGGGPYYGAPAYGRPVYGGYPASSSFVFSYHDYDRGHGGYNGYNGYGQGHGNHGDYHGHDGWHGGGHDHGGGDHWDH